MKNYKKVLYVVDMVNGFVNEGIMHDEYIRNTIDEQVKLIKKFKKENQGVALIKDNHKENCAEFNTFPKHCVIGTNEAELVDEIREYEEDSLVYEKNSTSAMFAKGLLEDLSKMVNLERVYVVGCCSDICVTNFAIPLVNYFDEHDLKVEVVTISDLIETYDAPYHPRDEYNEMANKLMKQAGVKLYTSKELGLEVKKNVRK